MFSRDQSRYAPEACEFWQIKRVPRSPLKEPTDFARWFRSDSESNYAIRGNRGLGIENVGYEFNSLGYRGDEFGRRPGEAIAVFVGDSNTFGVGIPWDRVWTSIVSEQLARDWNVPVRQCNLGWGGTGPDYAAMLIHQTVEALQPDVVFVLWSYVARMSWFPTTTRQVHFHPRQVPTREAREHAAYLRLTTEPHAFFNFVRDFHLVDARLAAAGVPWYWGTLERLSEELLSAYVPLAGYVGRWEFVEGDLARDGQHSGVESHARFARKVSVGLERDGFQFGRSNEALTVRPTTVTVSLRPAALGRLGRAAALPLALERKLCELRLRRRVRAIKQRDPFIY